jgi:hypothetical protein
VEAEKARVEGRNATAEQAQLLVVQWLMRVRALTERAQVVCPRAPFREGDEYSPRERIEWAEAVRRSDNDAHTDEEAAWEVRGKGIGRQLRQKWQGLLDGEGGNSKERVELFPKTFATVLGTVMGELQENGEIDESRSTERRGDTGVGGCNALHKEGDARYVEGHTGLRRGAGGGGEQRRQSQGSGAGRIC